MGDIWDGSGWQGQAWPGGTVGGSAEASAGCGRGWYRVGGARGGRGGTGWGVPVPVQGPS